MTIEEIKRNADETLDHYDMAKHIYITQQAKIELLEKELTETQAFLNNQNHIKQAKIDELQARVDEITNHVDINFDEERDDDQHSYWSGYNQAIRELNDILKGNYDEN